MYFIPNVAIVFKVSTPQFSLILGQFCLLNIFLSLHKCLSDWHNFCLLLRFLFVDRKKDIFLLKQQQDIILKAIVDKSMWSYINVEICNGKCLAYVFLQKEQVQKYPINTFEELLIEKNPLTWWLCTKVF